MKSRILIPVLVVVGVFGVVALWSQSQPSGVQPVYAANPQSASEKSAESVDLSTLSVATLAGGCFWCVESTLEKVDGIAEVVSGYTGGRTKDPTYKQVSSGGTAHTEATQVYYDPAKISYAEILHHFWREIDPTDSKGQFVDRGSMYRPAIYYHNESEARIARASRDALAASGRYKKPISIEISPAQTFYEAEAYHQNYYKTNPTRYKLYRHGSGRDQFLRSVWGEELNAPYSATTPASNKTPAQRDDGKQSRYQKPDDRTIRAQLNDLQYAVTQRDATEPPYQNEYWDEKRSGIYVDIVSGEPLFSSTDKYDSRTGWPSFTQPIHKEYIVEKIDYKLIFPRTEVRSRHGDSHLGHVFKDGPAPTGLRYCINSAALRFIAKDELTQHGYGEYAKLFR